MLLSGKEVVVELRNTDWQILLDRALAGHLTSRFPRLCTFRHETLVPACARLPRQVARFFAAVFSSATDTGMQFRRLLRGEEEQATQ